MALKLQSSHLVHLVSDQNKARGWNWTNWSSSTTAVLPWKPRVHANGWDTQTPELYQEYPKLSEERELANSSTIHFRLFDLPREIRNAIYRHFLIIESPTDLAPLASDSRLMHHLIKRAVHLYWEEIVPRLGLLRTCKKLCGEASSTFYGENEFRFSNHQGWYVLSCFLNIIGPRNHRLLRCIAIHPTWTSAVGTVAANQFPRSGLQDMGLTSLSRPQRRKFAHSNMRTCILHSKMILESAGTLTSFKPVIPESDLVVRTDVSYHGNKGEWPCARLQVWGVIERSKFPSGLQTGVVRLRRFINFTFVDAYIHHVRADRRDTYTDDWAVFARENGWQTEIVAHDGGSRYPLALNKEERRLNVCGEVYEDLLRI